MKIKNGFKLLSLILCFSILPVTESVAAIKNGGTCTKLNAKKVFSGYNFKCVKSGSKLVWRRGSRVDSGSSNSAGGITSPAPVTSPDLEVFWEGMSLKVRVTTPRQTVMQAESISGVKSRVKFGTVAVSKTDSEYKTSTGNQTITFNWDLSSLWNAFKLAPWPITVEAELVNTSGSGPANKKEIDIPLLVSSPSLSPTPTPLPSATQSTTPKPSPTIAATPTPAPTASAIPSPSPSKSPEASPRESINQINSKRAAANYLSILSFSRKGLIRQLEYEGYSRTDAEYGVDAQVVNWKEQAAKSAASYIKLMPFSYTGLLNQLIYDGFTEEEANFGTSSTGLTRTPIGPTATPQPSPSKSAASAEGGCQVLSPAALPFGNQRITVTNVVWEKDQSGYVSALFTIRNDNSMSLRLVQFTFYVFSGNSIVNLAQTLQGDNFFIKDDNKFNSVDGQRGAWLPGQSRTFRLPTNEILDCSSIRYSSSTFRVLQGIGDS